MTEQARDHGAIPRLATQLNSARKRRFIGRTREILIFQTALTAAPLPFHILFVHGPGGIGKSLLLQTFSTLCDQLGCRCTFVDARSLVPTPEGFLGGLRGVIPATGNLSVFDAFAAHSGRQVLLIDSYDLLAGIDAWVREQFLPQLPANTLIVIAGRHQPALAWRTDPGWRTLFQSVALRNFSPDESRAFLHAWEVPASQHAAVLQFTHGHPLALALVAEIVAQGGSAAFQIDQAPDMIHALLDQFIEHIPSPAHRAALDICAVVRLTTEPVLRALLNITEAQELFAWLRRLSFIESGRDGIFPQQMARETLAADLRWRDPAWAAQVRRQARAYYLHQLQQAPPHQQPAILREYIYLHRSNPIVRPFFAPREQSDLTAAALRESDIPALLAMVQRHEGAESSQLAAEWLARQPAGVIVFREAQADGSEVPRGLLCTIELHTASEAQRLADPAVAAAWAYLQRAAPLRANERATMFRFWMDRDAYQGLSQVQALIGVAMVQHYLTSAGLAFTFFPCADPAAWAVLCAYSDLERLPDADFAVGGHRYGVFGHDWRAIPPLLWLERLAEHEQAQGPADLRRERPFLLVLSEPDFAAAVRAALRAYRRPDELQQNPLLRSRLVTERVGTQAAATDLATALRACIDEACAVLQGSPRALKSHRALQAVYLEHARTQEQAAELLNLPLATLRRHLKDGTAQLTAQLWQMETRG